MEKELIGPFPLSAKGMDLCHKIPNNQKALEDLKEPLNIHTSKNCTYFKSIIFDSEVIRQISKVSNYKFNLWRSNVFIKNTGSHFVGIDWHHDKHFQNGNEPLNFNEVDSHISLLIAIGNIDNESGTFTYIKGTGSHGGGLEVFGDRSNLPSHKKSHNEHFSPLNCSQSLIQDAKIDLGIPHGHFILFNSALVHGMNASKGSAGRLGIAARFARSDLSIPEEFKDNSKS